MTTDLAVWDPPEKEILDKQSQYCQVLERRGDQAVLELIDEQRDELMRAQINTTKKFMKVINDDLDGDDLKGLRGKDKRCAIRSYAETLKIVSDVQKSAAMFDRVSKPKGQENETGRVNLFVSCTPIKAAIDVMAT